MSEALVQYNTMRQALVKAHQIDEVKDIRDRAEALRQYAKQAGESLENQNMIAEIKLRAERRGGELLSEVVREQGRRSDLTSVHREQKLPTFRETIDEADIAWSTARRWQSIAAIPEPVFEQAIAEVKSATNELTSAYMLRVAQECKREEMVKELKDAPVLPDQKYRVFYADPPWHYGNSGVIGESDNYGRAARHYPSMSIDQLCYMGRDVREAAEDNAVLFMWVTSPLLAECFDVIAAWGFEYKTSFVWDKVAHNYGHYNSVRHEFLLICTRGSCLPDNKELYDSVVSIEKSRVHSEKPEEFRRIIDSLYPHGKRIELFARKQTDGWDTWGNETSKLND